MQKRTCARVGIGDQHLQHPRHPAGLDYGSQSDVVPARPGALRQAPNARQRAGCPATTGARGRRRPAGERRRSGSGGEGPQVCAG